MRTMIAQAAEQTEKKVMLMGWVAARRDHGKIIFIDLRDKSGVMQCVFLAETADLYRRAEMLRPEWVLKIVGEVRLRPEKMINPDLPTGRHEVLVQEMEIINQAQTLPLPVDTPGYEVGEEVRLRYRYLDLRRARLQRNLFFRHQVFQFIRNYLSQKEFTEIETPIISKSTPEGARDYLVPSRIHRGKFYALPQSPQQYKQLLMVSGLERYFQIARCFRDEDTRGDRQPEFTQLDLEMSFAEREDVMSLMEDLYVKIVETLFPEKRISQKPFPRLAYAEAMARYGSDKPDLRQDKNDPNELAFAWIIDFPFFEKTDEGDWTFTHNPFSAPKKEHFDWLMRKENIAGILADQYDLALNGYEVGGGSIRNHRPEALQAVFEIMGLGEERIRNNFGHMLEALAFGAPAHGGIAMGLDRLLAVLMNEPNIREVIVFPKTGDGRDLMMGAPAAVDSEQLEELGLEFSKKTKKEHEEKQRQQSS